MMKKPLILALILAVSSLWPFAYSQDILTTGSQTSPNFCSLGNVGVVNLNYDDVISIQGIVTQDVLTSAENYRTHKALRELGEKTETKSSYLARKFRLYFVGPDGKVDYADVISDKFTSAQEWLLNTTIFGRVEYAGLLGEDLMICPDLPANEKGMCNYEAGKKIQDVFSRDWKVGAETPAEKLGQSYFSTVSSFVQMADSSNDPFGTVDVGMSRIRGYKYVVSLATPPDSQIFVIPKTYMYFMSQLKNVAQFEAVAQTAFLIGGIVNLVRGFRKAGNIVTNKEKVLVAPKDKINKARKILKSCAGGSCDPNDLSKALSTLEAYYPDALSKAYNGLDDVARNTLKKNIKSMLEMDLGPDVSARFSSSLDDLTKRMLSGDAEGIESALIAAGIEPERASKVAGEMLAHRSKWLEIVNDKSLRETIDSLAKERTEMRSLLSQLKNALEETDKTKRKAMLTKIMSDPENRKLLGKLEERIGDLSKAWDKSVSEEGHLITKLGIYGSPDDASVSGHFYEIVKEKARRSPFHKWLGMPGLPGEFMAPVLKARAMGTVGAFLRAYLKGLYYVGRPIVATAYGLQLFSEIVLMKGYLELAPPGMTLEWNPETTGSLFTKNSYIVIKGIPSTLSGMYSSGELGSLGAQQINGFLISLGVDPIFSSKYADFGSYLVFGYDFNPDAYQKIIRVEGEGKPTGITRIVPGRGGYLLRFANWKEKGMSVIEDPASMKSIGNNTLLTSVGMLTSGADIYGYIYGNPDQIRTQFPVTWSFAKKLSDFGFLSQAVTTASIIYLWPNIPRLRAAIGATLITGLSKSAFGTGRELMTAKATDMRSLEQCVASGKCARPSCEQVCAKCQAELGLMSGWLITSGIAQTVLDYSQVLAPVSFALGTVDMVVLEGGIPLPGGGIKLFEGKLEKTDRCLRELLTCNERNFIILAGSKVRDPNTIMEEKRKAERIKGLPGLDQLPVENLLKPLENMTSPVTIDQEQLNVHAEFQNASGRVAMRDIYYLHIIDATIDFLANKFPFTMCGLNDNGTVQECVQIKDNKLTYGNVTVESPLVPFKWIDTEMPAMIIPNTGIYVNTSGSGCAIFSVEPDGTGLSINPDLVDKFKDLGFEELERTFGKLRVINVNEGSLYPSVDIDGKVRLEFDENNGGYDETNRTVWLDASGKLHFWSIKDNKELELSFKSAVFSGGTIVKRGNSIFVLPRYFRPGMSGRKWREIVGPKPFQSVDGTSPAAVDAQGNILGINASKTKIPGAEKLGIITAVSGYKDLNGDGKIQDNEKVGWRFYKIGNKTFFDLYYKGKKETYDGDQVEISPDGTVRVYEKGKPHTDAYLLREISTRVDEMGRTLMTIKDGQGNKLLEDALITWIKGTGGSIQYNPDTNNYVFVNGQPIELNNEFKTNGFNAITGMPDPPLLQPSAVHGTKPWEKAKKTTSPPVVPTAEGWQVLFYLLAIIAGVLIVRSLSGQKSRRPRSRRS